MIQSAGILVYKNTGDGYRVLLTHPAGPIWSKRDTWSIPKGELDSDEDHVAAAFREFEEEVGMKPPDGELVDLGSIKQDHRKTNFVWAVEGDVDLTKFHCNTFTMEWPPRSGRVQEFPENDRADWFDLATAKLKLFKAQTEFIDRLAKHLGYPIPPADDFDTSDQQALI